VLYSVIDRVLTALTGINRVRNPALVAPPPSTRPRVISTTRTRARRSHVLMSLPVAGRNLSRGTIPSTLRLAKAYASPAFALSLRILPRLAKLVAYLLIILNVRSLPFGWHSKLCHPAYPFFFTTERLFFFVFTPSSLVLARRQDKMARVVCSHSYLLPFLSRS
jgi:hypothetical protein